MSEKNYDEDVGLIDSVSGSEIQSEDEEDFDFSGAPDRSDRQILKEVDEEEVLLGKSSRFDSVKNVFNTGRDTIARRRKRNEKRATQVKQDAEGSGNAGLIYEMEGGFKDNSSRSSMESLILENQKWNTRPSVSLLIVMGRSD